DDGRVAGGDVAERTGMDKCRRVLQRLEQVGLDGVSEHDGHRPRRVEVLRGDGLAVVRESHDDPAKAFAHVTQRGRQGEDNHDLARGGDVESRLPRYAVHARTKSNDDVAKRAIVDVEHASPGDRARVDAELVAL